MNEENQQAPQGQPEAAPAATNLSTPAAKPEAPSENKFDGKTPEELFKSYQELEKKLGDNSKEMGESRKYRENMDLVLKAIYANPTAYTLVDTEIKKMQGQIDDPTKAPPSPQDLAVEDTRSAFEAKIIDDFEKTYGIDKLEPAKRLEMHKKVGVELKDLLDPTGHKSTGEIIRDTSLKLLPKFLEKAYFFANQENWSKDQLQRKQNEEASIGGLPSSSGKSSPDLTALERETAKKQGITEEKYLSQKKKILEEAQKGV